MVRRRAPNISRFLLFIFTALFLASVNTLPPFPFGNGPGLRFGLSVVALVIISLIPAYLNTKGRISVHDSSILYIYLAMGLVVGAALLVFLIFALGLYAEQSLAILYLSLPPFLLLITGLNALLSGLFSQLHQHQIGKTAQGFDVISAKNFRRALFSFALSGLPVIIVLVAVNYLMAIVVIAIQIVVTMIGLEIHVLTMSREPPRDNSQ